MRLTGSEAGHHSDTDSTHPAPAHQSRNPQGQLPSHDDVTSTPAGGGGHIGVGQLPGSMTEPGLVELPEERLKEKLTRHEYDQYKASTQRPQVHKLPVREKEAKITGSKTINVPLEDIYSPPPVIFRGTAGLPKSSLEQLLPSHDDGTATPPGHGHSGVGKLPGSMNDVGIAILPEELHPTKQPIKQHTHRASTTRVGPVGHTPGDMSEPGIVEFPEERLKEDLSQGGFEHRRMSGGTRHLATGTKTIHVPLEEVYSPPPTQFQGTANLPESSLEDLLPSHDDGTATPPGYHHSGVGKLPGPMSDTGVAILPEERQPKKTTTRFQGDQSSRVPIGTGIVSQSAQPSARGGSGFGRQQQGDFQPQQAYSTVGVPLRTTGGFGPGGLGQGQQYPESNDRDSRLSGSQFGQQGAGRAGQVPLAASHVVVTPTNQGASADASLRSLAGSKGETGEVGGSPGFTVTHSLTQGYGYANAPGQATSTSQAAPIAEEGVSSPRGQSASATMAQDFRIAEGGPQRAQATQAPVQGVGDRSLEDRGDRLSEARGERVAESVRHDVPGIKTTTTTTTEKEGGLADVNTVEQVRPLRPEEMKLKDVPLGRSAERDLSKEASKGDTSKTFDRPSEKKDYHYDYLQPPAGTKQKVDRLAAQQASQKEHTCQQTSQRKFQQTSRQAPQRTSQPAAEPTQILSSVGGAPIAQNVPVHRLPAGTVPYTTTNTKIETRDVPLSEATLETRDKVEKAEKHGLMDKVRIERKASSGEIAYNSQKIQEGLHMKGKN